MSSTNMTGTPLSVSVRLEVITRGESHPVRYLTLSAPSYSVRIGRGSRSGNKDLFPDRHNAWFESRVMSREHAVLRAFPESKTVCIEDVGSMHGTYLGSDRIPTDQAKTLANGDPVLFGAEVSRGMDVFPALEVDFFFTWVDGVSAIQPAPRVLPSFISRNSFSVPDYESEEDEHEIMDDSPTLPNPKIAEDMAPAKPTAVPESDFSNGRSITSDNADSDIVEVRTSSVNTGSQREADKTFDEDVVLEALPKQSSFPQINSKFTYITDSESEYGDDISADDLDRLESDANLDTDVVPDSSSFSSHSPISPNNPRKLDLAFDHLPKLAPKVLVPPEPCEVEVKANKPTGTGIYPDALRAPSPSDAAMAKPTNANIEQPPWTTNQQLGNSQPYWVGGSLYQYPNRETNSAPNWSAMNSDWYSDTHPAFSSIPAPAYMNQERLGFPPYAMPQQNYYDEYRPIPLWTREQREPQNTPIGQTTDSFITIKAGCNISPKVSIQDIIRAESPEDDASSAVSRSKRKADAMSDEASSLYDAADDTHDVLATTFKPQGSYSFVAPVKQSSLPIVEEHTSKRVRLDPDESSNATKKNFMKYAGTALAGVAVGAVGAVAALIALPPDFFV